MRSLGWQMLAHISTIDAAERSCMTSGAAVAREKDRSDVEYSLYPCSIWKQACIKSVCACDSLHEEAGDALRLCGAPGGLSLIRQLRAAGEGRHAVCGSVRAVAGGGWRCGARDGGHDETGPGRPPPPAHALLAQALPQRHRAEPQPRQRAAVPRGPHLAARDLTQTAIRLLCTAAEGGAVEHVAAMTMACAQVHPCGSQC